MSLNLDTLWIADEVPSTPILVAREPGDPASLDAAIELLAARGRAFLADPILDPIPFGLAASIARYVRLRERYPRFDDFVALRDRLDPERMFQNPYLQRVLGE